MSPMTAALETENPAILNWFRDASAVGRLGVPQDLSPIVCYLLSDAGSFTTGADFIISGMFLWLDVFFAVAHIRAGGIHAGRLDHLEERKQRSE